MHRNKRSNYAKIRPIKHSSTTVAMLHRNAVHGPLVWARSTRRCSAVQHGAVQCRNSARCTVHHGAAPTTFVPMLRLGSLGMMDRAGCNQIYIY